MLWSIYPNSYLSYTFWLAFLTRVVTSLEAPYFLFVFGSRVDVWADDSHASIRHKYSGVLHLLCVRRDGRKFARRPALVVLIGRVANLCYGSHGLFNAVVLVELVMHAVLLREGLQGQGPLVEFLFLVCENLVVVRKSMANV